MALTSSAVRRSADDGPSYGGGRIDSHGDHRIAMAFAVAALRAREAIEIDDCANVATSFPGFIELARKVGLELEECAEEGVMSQYRCPPWCWPSTVPAGPARAR